MTHGMSRSLNVDCEFKLVSSQPLHREFRGQPKPVADDGARCPGIEPWFSHAMRPWAGVFSSWLLSFIWHKSGILTAPTWIHRGCCNISNHKESPTMSAGRSISINHGNDSGIQVQSPISCLLFNVSLLVLLNDECPQPPSTIQGEGCFKVRAPKLAQQHSTVYCYSSHHRTHSSSSEGAQNLPPMRGMADNLWPS